MGLGGNSPGKLKAVQRVGPKVARRHVPCNMCGSSDRNSFCSENGLGLVKCQHCGLVYVSPRPDAADLYALYGETYFRNDESGIVGYTNYLRDEVNIRRTFAGRLKRLEHHIKPGCLLDVGCAAGFFLDEAHKRGWQVQGVDVSTFAVQYAQERFGYDVRHGSLMDMEYTEGTYDLVTMWDVIEHVPDPMAYLRKSASLLRSGGIFALATPDVGSVTARLTGPRWVGYKLSEEHIYYFSTETLQQMLDKAGFDVVEARYVGKYVTMGLFLNRLGLYLPLVSTLLQVAERAFRLSDWSMYVNPLDIVAVTARKR